MSFSSDLKSKVEEYTSFSVYSKSIQLPYYMTTNNVYGGKKTPTEIRNYITANMNSSATQAQLQAFVNGSANKPKTGVDCSGFTYYTLNEATGGAVMKVFGSTYANGVSAATFTSTNNGVKCVAAKDIQPGCLMRTDGGGHVIVIYSVTRGANDTVTRIDYAHSNGSKGPHKGYITITNQNADLNASSQTWYDSAYTDAQAKSLYNYTIYLNCISSFILVKEIPVSAKLTVQGTNINVRKTPKGAAVTTLSTGATVQATGRAVVDGDPWFHISQGWINGKFVQGWVKDYNDANKWWYVATGYVYYTSVWKQINGQTYCFGPDGYMYSYCYIKYSTSYRWVNADGAWESQWNTTSPDRTKYKVVEKIT